MTTITSKGEICMSDQLQILELFGGIGSPRAALRNMGIPTKSIDYVEIDRKCVDSYNAMFEKKQERFLPQSVVGWTLQPHILIHGSPCQNFSVAGHQGKATKEEGRINIGAGGDEGSGTPSSLMWETIRIIDQLGEWKPKTVIWENVPNLTTKHMVHNFRKYLAVMESMGYTNSYEMLDARDFGLPQARKRVFTVSVMQDTPFDFAAMQKSPMRNIAWFLESNVTNDCYTVTQPTVYNAIGKPRKEIRRATIIQDYADTITTRPDRTPTQVIDMGGGKYRYLTELESWRLQGYTDADFFAAERACPGKPGKMNRTLYRQAGNSIPVPIFESLFEAMFEQGILPKVNATAI